MKTFFSYYIANSHGEGLHYIQGSLFWNKPDTLGDMLSFTSFDTGEKAAEFAFNRNIPGPVNIRKITYTIS